MFIRQALTDKIPILGICLGAQLLAKALDAHVKKSPVKEIGWYNVSLTEKGSNDTLFNGLSHKLEIFQWHEDTFDIPNGATLLAQAEKCKNQAFRYGSNAYGLQFHIETTPAMVEEWLNNDHVDKGEATRIILDTHRKDYGFRKRAQILLSNFTEIVKLSKKVSIY